MNIRIRTALVVAGMAVAATPLFAAPADSVRARVNGFRELGAAFKAVNDGLRSGEPQTVLIQQSARQIRNSATAMYTWFPAGSGPQSGVKTDAKPAIWAQPAQFKAAQDAFANQAVAFQRAANSGNVASIRMEARKLGGTCKGCHDNFRAEKN